MILLALWLAADPAACRQGAALFEQGQLTEAITALTLAARHHPASAYCAKALGTVQAAAGDFRAAAPTLARACDLDAGLPDACYYLARALYSLDRFEDSLAALAKARPAATKAWMLATARGQALDALGRNGAEDVLRQAWQQRKSDPARLAEPDPLLALTAFLYREGRGGEALPLLRQAPAGYTSLATYQYQLGRALAQASQWPEAAAALERAVALRPRYPEAHGLLSRCYYQLGKSAQAEQHARRARE